MVSRSETSADDCTRCGAAQSVVMEPRERSVLFQGMWVKIPPNAFRACRSCSWADLSRSGERARFVAHMEARWLGDGGRPSSEAVLAD